MNKKYQISCRDDTLVHIAISPNTDKGSVVWLEHVSDEEYNK